MRSRAEIAARRISSIGYVAVLWRRSLVLVALGLTTLLGTGCTVASDAERTANRRQETIGRRYRPQGSRPELPPLSPESRLADHLRFAILNEPRVEAAYYEWVASVRRITVERSLPDPRLTFEADLADMLMGLIPGLMLDLPGPGKLRAAAEVAAAESDAQYYSFESAVLRAAFALKKAYYELHFLDAKLEVHRRTLDLVTDLEELTRTRHEVGAVTLQDVLRAQIELHRLTTEIANLEDSRAPLLEQFKAALGLRGEDPTPPLPASFELTPLDISSERLLETARMRNPTLNAMHSELRRAEASLRLAYKARIPDFGLGVESDIKAAPVVVTPQVGITLPIWRDKIAAQIAASNALERAAEARLSAEEIALAVEFAEKSFAYRESTRTLDLLEEALLPRARQALEVARIGYATGRASFLDLIEAERQTLEFELAAVEARTQAELLLAELSLVIVGVSPEGAPLLPPEEAPGHALRSDDEAKP